MHYVQTFCIIEGTRKMRNNVCVLTVLDQSLSKGVA